MSDNNPFNKKTAFKASFQTAYQPWGDEETMQDAWLVPYNGNFWFMNDPEDMHLGYDLISIDALKALGEYSSERIVNQDFQTLVAERTGILLDTPELADFWEAMEPWQEQMVEVLDAAVHETVKAVFEKLIEDAGDDINGSQS